MPHWLIKTAIQHAISVLPYRQQWNRLFQKFGGTNSLELGTGMFERRLEHTRTHLEHFLERQSKPPTSFAALELGTGWFPTMAVGLYLCGASEVWTIDIDPLLKRPQMRRMLALFFEYQARNELQKHLPQLRAERFARLRELAPLVEQESPEAFLERLNIHVMVRDAQKTGLPPNSVDLMFSTGVLEYIPRPVLHGILGEFRRLCTQRAVMSHWISMIDQFSYFDRSITPFNYLRYTSRQWHYLNSPLIWQNRLRISDYRKLLGETGYEITRELNTSGSSEDLQRFPLAPEFQGYSKADLVVLTSWLVARPHGTAPQ